MKILLDGNYDARITYALNEMVLAFESQGGVVLINTGEPDLLAGTSAGSDAIRHMVEAGELPLKTEPESLAIGRLGDTLVLAGSDAQGLMYALLEVADQVEIDGKVIDQIEPISESPDTQFRGLYTFLHNEDCEREWFYSRDHWENYFDLLARSRYNSFQIVMAHQTSCNVFQ